MSAAPAETLPFERPLGAIPVAGGGTRFRVWAPAAETVAVRLADGDHELAEAGHGVWEGVIAQAGTGDDYRFVLGSGDALPDPCSRWQPEGLRGPSRVVDPGAWSWTDEAWHPPAVEELIAYELHVGTFTAEGTFDAVIAELGRLAELGVNAIELMPVADFPGMRGWGYDGVYPWAAHRAYGGPDGLQRLVDAAHARGIAVILDLVFNHVGSSGEAALRAFGPYFTDLYGTFWGEALNYDDAGSGGVREWAIQAAEYWVRDMHIDGVRLDAIHAIIDTSAEPLVAELSRRLHDLRPGTLVIAESGLNDPKVMRRHELGGFGCDAAWADDFHHGLRTLLTGELEGYYADFGTVAGFAKCWQVPFFHDGTWSGYRNRRFGAPAADLPPSAHVVFSANHDQVGNRAFGDRLDPALRPLAAFCVLLSPFVPMLFMGEEYGEPAPFQFFCDHIDPAIAQATRAGRRREFAAFAAFAHQELPDPQDPATFERSKLTREVDSGLLELHRRLIALRPELAPDPAEIVAVDEDAQTLVVRRGRHEIAMSFSDQRQRIRVSGTTVILSTAKHDVGPVVDDGVLILEPRSGAVIT